MEIKGIKSLNGSYILHKTRNRKNIVSQEHEQIEPEGYKITRKEIESLAKMQSAEGIKRSINELGMFLKTPELEMQR